MDTGLLKGFAAGACVELIKEVGARLDVVLAPGSVARAEAPGPVAALERAVGKDGREAVVDRVAYTWFNRIIALRFMDANGYTGVGVVSPEPGKVSGQPQVLSDAKGGDFDVDVVSAKTQATVTALLNDTRPSTDPQGEAYGLLLEAYCRFWNKAMPFMFEREGDYTELLMPTALLATDSVRDRAVRTLTDDVCGEVEVIGWLYQFYISERKDEVFAGFKKNKKAGAAEIPAATQLFTPHWIVRYLVENSLGRLWLLNHPESQLAERMDYYIPPVDEETDFLRVSSPEELKIIDPAVGSGHMLTYAFDLLYAIYEEQAYSPSEIPSKILEHNLYGAEIDPRAGALAAFALTMKAAKKRKLFLKTPVQPHICVLENVRFDQADLDYLWSLTSGSVVRSDADVFWNAFDHADTFGSLIQPNETLVPVLQPVVEQLETTGNLLATSARRVLDQAEQLSTRYHVVVANPPYMGSGSMAPLLSEFSRSRYPSSKADLFAMFISRCRELCLVGAYAGMITMQSWLFLRSFAGLRGELVPSSQMISLVQLGAGAFDTIGGAIVSTVCWVWRRTGDTSRTAPYIDLTAARGEAEMAAAFRALAKLPENEPRIHLHVPGDFSRLPGRVMAHALDSEIAGLFGARSVQDVLRPAVGLQTGDNERFLRQWFEVSLDRTKFDAADATEAAASGARWFPCNKGGLTRRWYGNQDYVINYEHGGRELLANRPSAVLRNPDLYFHPTVSWSKIGADPAFRLFPRGFVPNDKGLGLYGSVEARELALAVLNARFLAEALRAVAPTIGVEAGQLAEMPMPAVDRLTTEHRAVVAELMDISRQDMLREETHWGYQSSPLLLTQGDRVRAAADWTLADQLRAKARTHELELQNERLVRSMFGLAADQAAAWDAGTIQLRGSAVDAAELARELVSYAIGCMFGRYSLDVPGLVLANQGDSLQGYLARVPDPSFMPDADGVIPVVDGEWFEDDVVAKFRQFLRVAFGEEHFEENLKFVIDSLGVKDLRDYFVKSFYKEHVRRYKKRPIYWMFSSPKGSFNALVYLHRYNSSTVSTVLNEYLREFIKKLEVSLEQQERMVVSGANAREVAVAQKEAERLRKVLIELGDYERDLYDLASHQIDLDLDDGVLVNYQKFGAALKDIGLKKGGDNA